jgi:hypothetical protein
MLSTNVFYFLILNFRCVQYLLFPLLGVSPASGKPLKMYPTEGSETSANINQTLEIHPKVETVNNVFYIA